MTSFFSKASHCAMLEYSILFIIIRVGGFENKNVVFYFRMSFIIISKKIHGKINKKYYLWGFKLQIYHFVFKIYYLLLRPLCVYKFFCTLKINLSLLIFPIYILCLFVRRPPIGGTIFLIRFIYWNGNWLC